ncbi:MAG: hypothetical protein MZV63_47640 [Marinilabiliales bacterium]|nr:hypothetical protein [Marinilabiliales bacterium]
MTSQSAGGRAYSSAGFSPPQEPGLGADRLRDVAPAECGVHELLPQGTLSYRTVMQKGIAYRRDGN